MSTSMMSKVRQAPPCFRFLDCEMIEMGGTKAVIRCVPSERRANPFGSILGGIVAGIIDNAMGPAMAVVAPDRPFSTVNLTMNYLRPVMPGEAILASAEVVRMGSRQAYVEAKIEREGDKSLLVRASAMNIFVGR